MCSCSISRAHRSRANVRGSGRAEAAPATGWSSRRTRIFPTRAVCAGGSIGMPNCSTRWNGVTSGRAALNFNAGPRAGPRSTANPRRQFGSARSAAAWPHLFARVCRSQSGCDLRRDPRRARVDSDDVRFPSSNWRSVLGGMFRRGNKAPASARRARHDLRPRDAAHESIFISSISKTSMPCGPSVACRRRAAPESRTAAFRLPPSSARPASSPGSRRRG